MLRLAADENFNSNRTYTLGQKIGYNRGYEPTPIHQI